MMMDTQIRVKTDFRYVGLYNNLKNLVVGDFHELFFVCATLGYRRNRARPLIRPDDRFWSSTILPHEWACYYAIYIHESSLNIAAAANPRAIISRMEEYANGGMEVLIDELLGQYLISEDRLEIADNPKLSRLFLGYLYEESQEG